MESTDRPKLRPLETMPYSHGDQEGILLSDPEGLFEGQVWIPGGLLPVLACFTGDLSIAEIAGELTIRYRKQVTTEDVMRVAEDLSGRLCLEGPAAAAMAATRREEFARLSARPAVHAGSAGYPQQEAPLRERLDAILGDVPQSPSSPLLGLVAPHIDLERGVPGYRAAYRALRASPPADIYVLFGTSHQGPEVPLVPTRKDFETPLGLVETERDLVQRIAAEGLGEQPFADEILHLREHSLEFQVLFLKHCLGDHPFRIVPFLTGRLDDHPERSIQVQRIVRSIMQALEERAGQRVTFVAGADMAHVGPYFGDPELVEEPTLSDLKARDARSLDLLIDHGPDRFWDHVEGDGNTRRICGTMPMYLVSRLVREVAPGSRAELLDYAQAVAPDATQVVSFASIAWRQA